MVDRHITPCFYRLSERNAAYDMAVHEVTRRMPAERGIDNIEVWQVHNDTVTRAFRDVCRGFDQKDSRANVEVLFHGTTWDKAKEFAENGFNIPAIRPD